MAVNSLTSRQPASMTTPTPPCARKEVASKSPNMALVFGELMATTMTSPCWQRPAASCIMMLSPGCAKNRKRAPYCFCAGIDRSQIRRQQAGASCASWMVATPNRPSCSNYSAVGFSTFLTALLIAPLLGTLAHQTICARCAPAPRASLSRQLQVHGELTGGMLDGERDVVSRRIAGNSAATVLDKTHAVATDTAPSSPMEV